MSFAGETQGLVRSHVWSSFIRRWPGPDGVTGVVVLLFVGDIELLGDDGGGIAVAIAARLTSLAGADEVVVSSTVKDLVVGSGIRFQDRGIQALKGVPEQWRVFALQPT
jgi:class 3 adenylate cyclase